MLRLNVMRKCLCIGTLHVGVSAKREDEKGRRYDASCTKLEAVEFEG